MENIEKKIKKIGILVVDDMEAMRSMVNSCLREIGAENVCFAGNGQMAWTQLSNRKVDLIICDWDMPEVSGLDFLTRIRQSEKFNHIPFLMLTATIEKDKVMEAIKAGVNDYLSKPFQPKDLEYRVIKLLRKVTNG